jgi:hypothetical protein
VGVDHAREQRLGRQVDHGRVRRGRHLSASAHCLDPVAAHDHDAVGDRRSAGGVDDQRRADGRDLSSAAAVTFASQQPSAISSTGTIARESRMTTS